MHVAVAFAVVLCFVSQVQADDPYKPTWDSLDKRPTPEWFDDAKFGIFIHWGVYSVPSWAPVGTYAEWYWAYLTGFASPPTGSVEAFQAFHNKTYGPDFKYADFARMFHAELFDPKQWVDVFEASGAKYIVPTSKHHEGFTLWKSAQSWNWNAVEIGPHRDLLKELLDEVDTRPGMRRAFYYSLYEWFHPLYRSEHPHDYVDQVMLPQMYDLINNYRPHYLVTDGEWEKPSSFWNSTEFVAWLFNESPVKDDIVINDRWGSDTRMKHGGVYTPEYSTKTFEHKWEEMSGIDVHSFGLNRQTPASAYTSVDGLLQLLLHCVAYGGNLLLDVGPAADGTLPPIMQDRLLGMGAWLQVNGAAVYNTTRWTTNEAFCPDAAGGFASPMAGYNVIGQVDGLTPGATVYPHAVYMGKTASLADCEKHVAANSSLYALEWHSANLTDGFATMCYASADTAWDPQRQDGHTAVRKAGVDVLFTMSKRGPKVVNAILMRWPSDGTVVLENIKVNSPKSMTVEFLGYGPVPFAATPTNAMSINLTNIPVSKLPCEHKWVFAIKGL